MTTRRKGEPKGAPEGVKVVVQNRRARFDYAIEDRYEAGLVLSGSEVKSLRAGNVSLSDAYAQPRGAELFLLNCRIGEYQPAAYFGHSPLRDRKLLLKREELDRIRGKVEQRGYTLVPLDLHYKGGRVKASIALAKGKAEHDKRNSVKEKDWEREKGRLMRHKVSGGKA